MPRWDDDGDYSRYDNGDDSDNHYDYYKHYEYDDYQCCDFFYDYDDDGERRRRSLMIKVMTPALYAMIGWPGSSRQWS